MAEERGNEPSRWRDRWALFKSLYWHPVVAVVLIAYAVLAAVQTIAANFWSAKTQRSLRLGNHLPRWSGWEWLSIGLAILLLVGFEGTVSMHRKHRKEMRRHPADAVQEDAARQETACKNVKADLLVDGMRLIDAYNSTGDQELIGKLAAWVKHADKRVAEECGRPKAAVMSTRRDHPRGPLMPEALWNAYNRVAWLRSTLDEEV